MVPTNAVLAVLLSDAAEAEEGHRRRALRRAGRAALLWPEEAADLDRAGRPLTELRGSGRGWRTGSVGGSTTTRSRRSRRRLAAAS